MFFVFLPARIATLNLCDFDFPDPGSAGSGEREGQRGRVRRLRAHVHVNWSKCDFIGRIQEPMS